MSRVRYTKRRFLELPICIVLMAWSLGGPLSEPAHATKPLIVERLLAAIEADTAVDSQARELLRSTWAACQDCDPAEFMAQALAVVSPEFRGMLDAYEQEDNARAEQVAGSLRQSSNPFVAANAAAYEIKALAAMDRCVDILARSDDVQAKGGAEWLDRYSYLGAETAFLRGYCLANELQFSEAGTALEIFLDGYPDAPQRLTLAARQMLLEIANREAGRIGEVVDLMQNSQGRLQQGDTGPVVQARQKRIVDLLDKLVEETEQQEKKKGSCKNPGEGGGAPSEGEESKGSRNPQSPMQESILPGGNPTPGELHEARRANPAEAWGGMPAAERDRILQALRESFPGRYRQLVEQYYEELAKKP